ncbi:MAG: alpha/beta fold hydrolase [Oleiphilaceae bacterium]|nr:alpha/beta fold hydrolase [Oleiphilaceae bacterium]
MEVQHHALTCEDGIRITLVQVTPSGAPIKANIVMVPGLFTNTAFWLSAKGKGLAAYLADQGFCCWLVKRRGLGEKVRRTKPAARLGLDEHVAFDLPAVQTFVADHNDNEIFWLGHSFGGVAIAKAFTHHLDPERAAGIVLLASQCEVGLRSLKAPTSWLLQSLAGIGGAFPSKRLGLGNCDEPPAAMRDACAWVRASRAPRHRIKVAPFFKGFSSIDLPLLALVGKGDRSDPPEGCARFVDKFGGTRTSFEVLGREAGFLEDYTHAGIVVSQQASQDVWPLIGKWIDDTYQATGSV